MYIIRFFDVYNDVKSTKKTCKPIECATLEDVDMVQNKIQLKQQKIHGDDARVLVHYTNTENHNPKSENVGLHNYVLKKWL